MGIRNYLHHHIQFAVAVAFSILFISISATDVNKDEGTVDVFSTFTFPLYSTEHHHPSTAARRHHNRRRRRRRRTNEDIHPSEPLELTQGYGTHFVQLYIGHPNPTPQTFIVDTGSEATAMPCTGCHFCGAKFHTHAYWDTRLTTSYERATCGNCVLGNCPKTDEDKERGEDSCFMKHAYEEGTHWYAIEGEDWAYLMDPNLATSFQSEEKGINQTDVAGNGYLRGRGEGIDVKGELDSSFQSNVEQRKKQFEKAMKFRLSFGCMYELTGAFRTQLADGKRQISITLYPFL